MLSTTAEYALRIMTVLAASEGGPVTSERIAELTSVPTDYSVKVLQMLGRASLVRAQRGRGGGFRLACDPAVTSLLDVIDAIDPFAQTPSCPIPADRRSDHMTALYAGVDGAIGLVRQTLGQTSLEQVVRNAAAAPAADLNAARPVAPEVTVRPQVAASTLRDG
jgi:Rrf2 family nitric oxide-sensitive transcriptional repressor